MKQKKPKRDKFLEKALKKIPKKRRTISLQALEQYNKGAIIKAKEDVDQAELMRRIINGEIYRQV